MKTITATEASRRFSDLLDAVARGETVTVTRGNRPIAEVRPARRRTGKELRAALEDLAPLDAGLEADIESATSLLTSDMADAWHDA